MTPDRIRRRPIGRLLAALLLVVPLSSCTESPDDFAGMVSAASPEAATAGREVLEAGGNALDAAVAVAFALAVTEPAGSGLGGQAILLVHPGKGEPFVVNGTTLAPGAYTSLGGAPAAGPPAGTLRDYCTWAARSRHFWLLFLLPLFWLLVALDPKGSRAAASDIYTLY